MKHVQSGSETRRDQVETKLELLFFFRNAYHVIDKEKKKKTKCDFISYRYIPNPPLYHKSEANSSPYTIF